ncbi:MULTISPECIES: Nif3-like dinuclear metal center hexameric protein [unclassified Helicobacter]|uniref:Nif3-like dinuclear metal center hexameric protein n=1 Tax=unclassified Helicobacter TaxID=2593540 RepID=UPI0009EEAC4C|nr:MULTISPECIES: Nif3-like dinuclear metal center hexameric protein [unclassified Helicobacter]
MAMLISHIYEMLDSISPFSLQEAWDNSGLNIGNMHQEVESIHLALELDMKIARDLPPRALIITHHPLIFAPLKAINTASYPAKLIEILLQKQCALIAMHTNFDTTHLNAHFTREILGFANAQAQGIAQMCEIEPTPISALAMRCKNALKLEHIRYTRLDSRQKELEIHRVYVVCGSGASYAREILTPNSCLITGDVKYHDAMCAQCVDVGFIDVEHYASEREFAKILKSILQIKHLNATIAPNFSPFSYV